VSRLPSSPFEHMLGTMADRGQMSPKNKVRSNTQCMFSMLIYGPRMP
jgi:hypothetical protein